MITRLIACATTIVLSVLLLLVLTASPASALCFPRCTAEELEGTILDGLMPNIILGLLIGLLVAVIASFFAFREGKKRAPMSTDSVRVSEDPDR